jgi:hypothetical protein
MCVFCNLFIEKEIWMFIGALKRAEVYISEWEQSDTLG